MRKLHLFTNKARPRKAQSINHFDVVGRFSAVQLKLNSVCPGVVWRDRKGTRNSIMSSSCFVGLFIPRDFLQIEAPLTFFGFLSFSFSMLENVI